MKKIVYFLILFCSIAVFPQANSQLFEEATQAYNNGNYEAAVEKYEQILDNDETSVAVYYNLGNAFYKQNQIASSIFYYEKALQLSPNDSDVNNNLAFARQMTVDDIKEVPDTGLAKIVNNLISKLNYNGWAILSVITVILFSILFLVYYFSDSSKKKRVFFVSSFLFLGMAIIGVVFSFLQFDIQQSKRFAIVFAEEISVSTEPNSRAEEAFILHEGTKVKVLENFSGYEKIELADGRQGWLTEDAIRRLQ